MKKIRLCEVLLMVIPAVALGVFAWKGQSPRWPPDTKVTTHGAYGVQIREVKIEPATARQVYEGFDTQVIISYQYPDVKTATGGQPILDSRTHEYLGGEKLISQNKSYRTQLQDITQPRCTEIAVEGGVYGRRAESCSLRLRDIPQDAGEIRFRKTTQGISYDLITSAGTKRVATRSADVSVVVRRAGEKISLPQVSKYRPFRLQSITVHKVAAANRIGKEDTMVRLVVEKTEPFSDESRYWCATTPGRLVDSKGQEWPKWNSTFEIKDVIKPSGTQALTAEHDFLIPLRLIPKSAGRVTFKTNVYYKDYWPLSVEIVVREK